MKKKSPPYPIIAAIALGAIGVFLYMKHESDQRAAAEANLQKMRADLQAQIDAAKAAAVPPPVVAEAPDTRGMRKVLYATQPIDPGVRINRNFFETKLTPADILPDAYTDQNDVTGWFATRNIEKGDALTPRNVGKELPFMEGRITPGMRALSLQVFNGGEQNNTGGFAVDGDRVDLLMSRLSEDGSKVYDTQLVMQNLKVLFVPGSPIKTNQTQGINPAPTPGSSVAVTFEVTPEQAQALVLLSQAKEVRFSMILRSRRDVSQIKTKPFVGYDYYDNPRRLQKTVDKSIERVQELGKEIDEQEKKQGQGNTNETSTPKSP